ncbi:GreA/GreB family elongation factor [Pseudonocardia sp. WMMC193]|uniref:GreA/GreB family elongation factor n=1 Tax=Pseudonocardia sp. WMMC193 TaxID=2911965 RepID=UPI001F03230D|nr:GreA/GreB family elongation factor [Pseudonocardia sp. WMMC193]MCF7548622.1 GreA/GreB family elongation factor [Pseudonocardia sp. WMMC193]
MAEKQVWLAQSAYERVQRELVELLRRRSADTGGSAAGMSRGDGADPSTDQQVLTARRDRENRIRKLQELLQNPVVGEDPPDDGVAEPGMVLTVRYEDDQETETFLLAHSEDGAYPPELMICSPDSPLGRALPGREQGATVRYTLPNGHAMEVTLISAAPYRPDDWSSTAAAASRPSHEDAAALSGPDEVVGQDCRGSAVAAGTSSPHS